MSCRSAPATRTALASDDRYCSANPKLRILRSAHPDVQSLLIQAAWRMSRSSDAKTAGLRAWANAITHRRGKKVAMVALARRLARILFAMWRDETDYQAKRVRVIGGTASMIVDATATVI